MADVQPEHGTAPVGVYEPESIYSKERCQQCDKTQNDYDREGHARAVELEELGYAVPGIRRYGRFVFCDYCVDDMNDVLHPPIAQDTASQRRRPRRERVVSVDQRIRIYKRDGFKCRKCSSTKRLSIDHVIPRSKGGSNDDDNLQTLCMPCNSRKGVRHA